MPSYTIAPSPAPTVTISAASRSGLSTRPCRVIQVTAFRPATLRSNSPPLALSTTLRASRSQSQRGLVFVRNNSRVSNVLVKRSTRRSTVRASASGEKDRDPMIEAEPYEKDTMYEAEPYEPASAPEPAEVSTETAVMINEAETIDKPKAKSSLEGVASTIYSILLIGFAITSAAMLSTPAVVLASMTIPSTAATPLFLRILGAVQLYCVAAAYTLKDAAKHDRLGSSTYKRLNLGMIAAALGTMAFKGPAEQAWRAGGVILNNPYYMWASLISLFLIGPFYIYIESVESKLEQIPTLLVAGTIELPKALLASANTVSKVYAGLAVMTTAAAGVMFYAPFPSMQVFFKPALDAGCIFDKMLIQVIASMLLLFASALYTLQDAANRDRLAASTFRALNLTLAVKGACLAMAYMAAVASGLGTAVTAIDGVLQAGLGAFGAYGYVTYTKEEGSEKGSSQTA